MGMKKESDDKKNDMKLYGLLAAVGIFMAIIGFVAKSDDGVKLVVFGVVCFFIGIGGMVKSA
jgi:hypothetical protein